MRVSLDSIEKVTRETLESYKVPEKSIEILVRTIQYANRCGINTHGIRQLPMYIKKIEKGHLNPDDKVQVVKDFQAVTLFDAHGTFGQVAAYHAMENCIMKAKKYGISIAGIRNSNTFGAAGYFGDYAAQKGMASMIFANAAPAIAPTGGKVKLFGTNPLCFSFPGSKEKDPIVLDMATTVVARSKVRSAARNSEKIPLDWAIGPDGEPTDDPNVALLGSLLPIGGYKGYGLSLFIDLFAGLMTGSAFAGEVKPLSLAEEDSRNGQLFILVNVNKMMSEKEREEKVDILYKCVKDSGEDGKVFLPGEPGFKLFKEQTDSIEMSRTEFADVNRMASELSIVSRLEEIAGNNL